MKKTKFLFFIMCAFVFIGVMSTSNSAIAATISNIKLTGVGASQARYGAYAGLYELDVDGVSVLAMCDDRLTSVSIGDVWSATEYTFSEIQAGAPVKFSSLGVEKYSQAGYLVSLLASVSNSDKADINLAIWNIMSPGSTALTATALSYYNNAISGAYDNFDFSTVMTVLTPDPLDVSQEYLVPTVVPVSSAVWLFGSGLVGLAGVARRRKAA